MKKAFLKCGKKSKMALATIAFMILNSRATFAQQTAGSNSDISTKITSLVNSIKGPLDLVVGALGLVGAFYVFFLYKSGKPEAKDNLVKLVIGLAIWFLIVPILKVFGLAGGIV